MRMSFCRAFMVLGVVAALSSPAHAAGESMPPQPAAQLAAGRGAQDMMAALDPVRGAIRRQMEAIRARDAAGAFALTTAGFHEDYKNAGDFLGRIRAENRILYNYADFRFLDGHVTDNAAVQRLEVHDRFRDDPVTVIFRLQRQEDGQWLIDSFAVLDADAQPI
ncbi:MAG: DUF4864 domain-containing protein [Proteobacteria bacterium]|nr:DUF4864 domain-containing protein [Pseudomonadota bacterium]